MRKEEAVEKLTKQLTRKYAFLQSAYWISQCAIGSFAAVFLRSKDFDNTQIGIVLSLASILAIILQLSVASFADKTKKIPLRYIVIALMFVVITLALILYIVPDLFLLIACIYVLIIAMQSTLNTLFNSLAVEYMNKGIFLNYGLARGMGSISFAITSYLLGTYITNFGPGILLSVFIFFYILVIVAAFTFKANKKSSASLAKLLQDTDTNNKRGEGDQNSEGKMDIAPSGLITFFKKYKKFSFLLIGIAMLFFSLSLTSTYLINIIESVGGNSTDMGISLSIAASVELPIMAAFIYIVKKIKCNTLVKISAFFFLVKVVIVWLAPNVYIIYLSQSLQMLAYALFTPASVYYTNSIIEEQDKVKGQSMLGVAMCVAGTIANITGGKLLDTVGVTDMLLLGTIVTAIGFIVVCVSTEKIEVAAV